MRWSDIPFHPSAQTLRQFAVLWIIAFAWMAGWQWFRRDHHLLAGILALMTAVGFWGCWRPGDLRLLFAGWLVLAFPIGWTLSTLALACLFFGVFTPMGLFFRVLGRDPLHLRPKPLADSYWQPKIMSTDPRSYFNQY